VKYTLRAENNEQQTLNLLYLVYSRVTINTKHKIGKIKLMASSQYDEKFLAAINIVLTEEGGYSNNPKDPGGETKYGISKRSYPNVNIAALTIDGAKSLYYRDFWQSEPYQKINNTELATKLFSLGVNMGHTMAFTLIQRALRAVGTQVDEDGVLGDKTITAINAANAPSLLAALRSEAASYYRTLAAKNNNVSIFLKGWLNRAYA